MTIYRKRSLDSIEKALNPKQLGTLDRIMEGAKTEGIKRRAYRVRARDYRGPEENRRVQAAFSRNAILERGRVPRAARKRGYDYLDLAQRAEGAQGNRLATGRLP